MKNEVLPKEERRLKGTAVSAGIAMGPAFVIDQRTLSIPEYPVSSKQVQHEIKRFGKAIEKAKTQLSMMISRAAELPLAAADDIVLLLEAHRGMLSSSRLTRGVELRIEQEFLNAEAALQRQMTELVSSFSSMDDAYLAARATDVQDVSERVLRYLLDQTQNPFADAPRGSVLMTENVTPASAALIDPEIIIGFASVLGGVEGHAAIMARSLELPCVFGVTEMIGAVENGDRVILDGKEGAVILNPTEKTWESYKRKALQESKAWKELKDSLKEEPSVTKDGHKITLQVNLELPREVKNALSSGGEGIGLLRTEFMFMNRKDLPSEDEQEKVLSDLLEELGDLPLTIRTLDVGGEKLPVSLNSVVGDGVNPSLGLRAIRLGLRIKSILKPQLAAILRVAAKGKQGQVRILIPMVSSVKQMQQVRQCMVEVATDLRSQGHIIPDLLPPLGAMIEIPSAALIARPLSDVCDFFSIGSNDLTQYTLAIDRVDDRVADLYNSYHPAVLHLIYETARAAIEANIPVSLCGEIAGKRATAAMLFGMGITELSMSSSRVPFVKQHLIAKSFKECQDFAQEILEEEDEDMILKIIEEAPKA